MTFDFFFSFKTKTKTIKKKIQIQPRNMKYESAAQVGNIYNAKATLKPAPLSFAFAGQ